jgi:hypothetical protein
MAACTTRLISIGSLPSGKILAVSTAAVAREPNLKKQRRSSQTGPPAVTQKIGSARSAIL